MTSGQLVVRPMRTADLDEVLEVMRRALGETANLRRTPELFTWKHLENPFGRSIVLIAESGGRIAGLRAFMRWELVTAAGARLRCVRPVDTATHPDFRRQGVFRKLTLEALDAARDDGVDLVFNTPNPESGAGYLKMGWSEVGPIGVMALPGRRLLGRRLPDGTAPDADFLAGPPTPAVGLDVVDREPLGLRTPRTGAYLQWRFTQHPTAGYQRVDVPGGTAVVRPNVRNGRRELVVSDLFGSRRSAAIGAAWWRSRTAYLGGWFSPGSPERSAAMRRGMLPVPRLTSLTLVAHPLRALPVDVTSPAAWDFASSDLELL